MNLPRVTEIIASAGLMDFSRVPEDLMRRAQEFGSAFHMARHLCDKGTLDEATLSAPLVPCLNAYKQFKKDFDFTVIPSESERSFVSKKWGFRGTPDLWPVIDGKRILIDTKTSTQMYDATGLQLAAYQILLEDANIKVHARWGLQVKEDGTYRMEKYDDTSDRSAFLSCLNLYNWKKRKGLICGNK